MLKANRVLRAGLALLLVLCLGGCMGIRHFLPRKSLSQHILDEMHQYLVERYGEFEYEVNFLGLRELMRPSSDEAYLYIQRGETEQERDWFRVIRYGHEDEGYYYRDNYYWHIIRDEYEAQMEQELAVLFPTCKVFLTADATSEEVPEEINGQTTLAEAQAIGLPKHMFWIVVDPATMNETQFTGLEEELKNHWNFEVTQIDLRIFFPVSKQAYENIGRYNYLDSTDQFTAEINN